MSKNYRQGFIPLIGLITTAFLAVAVFVGTAIVSNPENKFDLRQMAAVAIADGDCLIPGASCASGKSYFDASCPITEDRCGKKTTASSPKPTPSSDTEKKANGQCLDPGESSSSCKS